MEKYFCAPSCQRGAVIFVFLVVNTVFVYQTYGVAEETTWDPQCSSNCSWSAYELDSQSDHFYPCVTTQFDDPDSEMSYDTCPLPPMIRGSNPSVSDRPRGVTFLHVESYMAQQTKAGISHACLNISFTLDPHSASKVKGVQFALHGLNYASINTVRCKSFIFSTALTFCSVLTDSCDTNSPRTFYYDCFCKLPPRGQIHVGVRTLPIDLLNPNRVYDTLESTTIVIPEPPPQPLAQRRARWPSYPSSRQLPNYSSFKLTFELPPEDLFISSFKLFLYKGKYGSQGSYLYRILDFTKVQVEERDEASNSTVISFTYKAKIRDETEENPASATSIETFDQTFDGEDHQMVSVTYSQLETDEDYSVTAEISRFNLVGISGIFLNASKGPNHLNCPSTIIQQTVPNKCYGIVEWSEPFVWNNSFDVISCNQTHHPGEVFELGETTITYTFTDLAGMSAKCIFRVRVIDEEGPALPDCPGEIVKAAEEDQEHGMVSWNINATDNCGVLTGQNLVTEGTWFPLGETVLTAEARDHSGNVNSCDIRVIIEASPWNQILPIIIAVCCVSTLIPLAIYFWCKRKHIKLFIELIKEKSPESHLAALSGNQEPLMQEVQHPQPSSHTLMSIDMALISQTIKLRPFETSSASLHSGVPPSDVTSSDTVERENQSRWEETARVIGCMGHINSRQSPLQWDTVGMSAFSLTSISGIRESFSISSSDDPDKSSISSWET